MSVATAPTTLDVSNTPAVPFGRLVRVELRKLADTRAGRWLLISIAALTLLVLIIQLSVVLGQDLHPKFLDFLGHEHPDGRPAARARGAARSPASGASARRW